MEDDELTNFGADLDAIMAGKEPPKRQPAKSAKVAAYRPLKATTGNKEYDAAYDKFGQQFNIDSNLLFAQGHQESGFKKNAVSNKNARGIAQFIGDTAKEFNVDVNDPIDSIRGQAQLMARLRDRTGDIELALAGYNSGHNASVEQLRRNRQRISETRDYVNKITKNYSRYADASDAPQIDELGDFTKGLDAIIPLNNQASAGKGFQQGLDKFIPQSAPNELDSFRAGMDDIIKAPAQTPPMAADILQPYVPPSAQTSELPTAAPKTLSQWGTVETPKMPQVQTLGGIGGGAFPDNIPAPELNVTDYENALQKNAIPQNAAQTAPPVIPAVVPQSAAPQSVPAAQTANQPDEYQKYLKYAQKQDSPEARKEYESLLTQNESFGQVETPSAEIAAPQITIPTDAAVLMQNNSANKKILKTDDDIFGATAGRVEIDVSKAPAGMDKNEFIQRASLSAVGLNDEQINRVIDYKRAKGIPLLERDATGFEGTANADVPYSDLIIGYGGDANNIPAEVRKMVRDRQTDANLELYTSDSALAKNEFGDDIKARDILSAQNIRASEEKFVDYELEKQAKANEAASVFGDNSEEGIAREVEFLRKAQLSESQIKESEQFGQSLNQSRIGQLFGGVLSSVGSTGDFFAGMFRPLKSLGFDLPSSTWSQISQANKIAANESQKNADYLSQGLNIVGSLPLELTRLGVLSKLPTGAIVGFATDAGARSAGRNESIEQIAAEAAKGGALGALFGVGAKAGQMAQNQALRTFVNPVFEAGKETTAAQNIAARILGDATRIGTVTGGTFAVEKVFGTPTEEAIQSAIMNGVFDTVQIYGAKGLNKIYRVWQKGTPTDIKVEANGETFVMRNQLPDKVVDIELILDPTDGVYKTRESVGQKIKPENNANVKASTAPENQTLTPVERIGETAPPRELLAENPLRTEPKTDAMAKAETAPPVESSQTTAKPQTSFEVRRDSRLEELGFDKAEIADMSGAEKMEIINLNKPKEITNDSSAAAQTVAKKQPDQVLPQRNEVDSAARTEQVAAERAPVVDSSAELSKGNEQINESKSIADMPFAKYAENFGALKNIPEFVETQKTLHKQEVQKAIKAGKEISVEVIKDYPDLASGAKMLWAFPVKDRIANAKKTNFIEKDGKTYTPSTQNLDVRETSQREIDSLVESTKAAHRFSVEDALKDGKAVPAEVLADYPDLAKKYEETQPLSESPAQMDEKPLLPNQSVESDAAAKLEPAQALPERQSQTNFAGKKVSVGGQNGVVVGTSFGKVKVKFDNGTRRSIEPNKIKSPIAMPERPQFSLTDAPSNPTERTFINGVKTLAAKKTDLDITLMRSKAENKNGATLLNQNAAESLRQMLGDIYGDGQQSAFFGGYLKPVHVEMLQKYLNDTLPNKAMRPIAKQNAEKLLQTIIDGADSTHGDNVILTVSPDFPEGLQKAREEELAHRADARTRGAINPELILENPAALKAAQNLKEGLYGDVSDASIAQEVIAKTFRSDAETELSLSKSDLKSVKADYLNLLLDNNVKPDTIVTAFTGVSESAGEFTKDVRRTEQTNLGENGRGRQSGSSLIAQSGRTIRETGNSNRTQFIGKDTNELARLRRTEIASADRSGNEALAVRDAQSLETRKLDKLLFDRAPTDADLDAENIETEAVSNFKKAFSYIYDGKRDVSAAEAVMNVVRTGYLAGFSVIKTNLLGNTTNIVFEQAAKPFMAAADILNPKAKDRTVPGLSSRDIAQGLVGKEGLLRSEIGFNKEDFGKSGILKSGVHLKKGFIEALFKGVDSQESARVDMNVSSRKTSFVRNTGVPLIDVIIEGTKRLVTGVDRPFKAYARTAEKSGLARLEASKDRRGAVNALKNAASLNKDWRKKMLELRRDPSQLMDDVAERYAEVLTFQNPNAVTQQYDKFRRFLIDEKAHARMVSEPTQRKIAKYVGSALYVATGQVAPFVGTPSNVGFRAGEYFAPTGIFAAAFKFTRIGKSLERTSFVESEGAARTKFVKRVAAIRGRQDRLFQKETDAKITRLDKQKADKLAIYENLITAAEKSVTLNTSAQVARVKAIKETRENWLEGWNKNKEKYEAERKALSDKATAERKIADKIKKDDWAKEDAYADLKFSQFENRAFAEAAGRAGFGATFGGMALLGVIYGLIKAVGTTDYNEDRKRAEQMREGGIPNNTISIGGYRFPYSDSAFGKALMMGINLFEQYEREGSAVDRTSAMTKRFGKDVTSLNPLTSQEFSQDDWASYAGSKANSMTPILNMKILQEIGEVTDDKQRKYYSEGFAAQYLIKIPGARSFLPEGNPVGGEQERGGVLRRAARFFDPLKTTKENISQDDLSRKSATKEESAKDLKDKLIKANEAGDTETADKLREELRQKLIKAGKAKGRNAEETRAKRDTENLPSVDELKNLMRNSTDAESVVEIFDNASEEERKAILPALRLKARTAAPRDQSLYKKAIKAFEENKQNTDDLRRQGVVVAQ